MTRTLLIASILSIVAGLIVVLASHATTADAVGAALMGFGAVGLVSLVFLLIGLSEDEDRRQNPHG